MDQTQRCHGCSKPVAKTCGIHCYKKIDHVIEYQAQCRCGWRSDPTTDSKVAEIQADAHEASKIGRRSHQHDASTIEVTR